MKYNNLTNCTPIEEYITEDFGALGTATREQFEVECDAFLLGEKIKEERIRAGLSQEQLAQRSGMPARAISRIENGWPNVTFASVYRLFAGLGRNIRVAVM